MNKIGFGIDEKVNNLNPFFNFEGNKATRYVIMPISLIAL